MSGKFDVGGAYFAAGMAVAWHVSGRPVSDLRPGVASVEPWMDTDPGAAAEAAFSHLIETDQKAGLGEATPNDLVRAKETYAAALAECRDRPDVDYAAIEQERLRKDCVAALSGLEAEIRGAGEGQSDRPYVGLYVQHLVNEAVGADAQAQTKYIDARQAEAEELVGNHWTTIAGVVAALGIEGSLDANRAFELIHSLSRQPPGP